MSRKGTASPSSAKLPQGKLGQWPRLTSDNIERHYKHVHAKIKISRLNQLVIHWFIFNLSGHLGPVTFHCDRLNFGDNFNPKMSFDSTLHENSEKKQSKFYLEGASSVAGLKIFDRNIVLCDKASFAPPCT